MASVAARTISQLALTTTQDEVRWFHPWGSVTTHEDGQCAVQLGGALLGWFGRDDRDRSMRNVLLVTLANAPKIHFGHLATAFGVTDRYLWVLRQKVASDGIGAVLLARMGGKSTVSEQKRRQLHAWFAEGMTPTEACRRQGRRGKKLSRATISRERAKWVAEKAAELVQSAVATLPNEDATAPSEAEATRGAVQLALLASVETVAAADDQRSDASPGVSERVEIVATADDADDHRADASAPAPEEEAAVEPEPASAEAEDSDEPFDADAASGDATPPGDETKPVMPQHSQPVRSGRMVQHLGTWLMMALANRDGLHQEAAVIAGPLDSVRIALDAVIASLAIGERTVEGVRRIATPTAPLLLRVDHTPTASGVRRRLWELGEQGGGELLARMSARYIAEQEATDDEPAVFYVDNHLRPYTGQQTLRKGWRMQDKRVQAGTTDYYIHDEDGRPMFRIDVPSHDSLTQWLMPIATRLREDLGVEQRILLAFDRAGSFPVEMSALRDQGFEFVAYERKPYAELPTTAFDRTVVVRGETYRAHEGRLKNLGKGRGRVRRIALRTPEGAQINLLAISTAPLERLVGILLGDPDRDDASGRWVQENGFKHGVERWGLNQLDGRKVVAYPPGTIIPNPRRSRLKRALQVVRAEEGRARCRLAELALDDSRRAGIEEDLRDALERRTQLELLRPLVPKRAPIEETELAGKLVHHRPELKVVVDTVRIVCANIEADLASALAPSLARPAEAKKAVANILAAPGSVTVTDDEIRIRLAPAANRNERVALRDLFSSINGWNLTMPGDLRCRRLHLSLQSS